METPIFDFVSAYARGGKLRLHMPGHKGQGPLGPENLDITEVTGADSLYAAEGIIARSEEHASALFGKRTFYSTEGSSHCIRAMLYLVSTQRRRERPLILAGRNVHKAFVTAAVLMDADIRWLWPAEESSYLSCPVDGRMLEKTLDAMAELPDAVYVTSPDYLGNTLDIRALAEVCHKRGILLLVDNAHGAYLHFLPQSRHPMDLGADLCCDSAHKTLPVLTGGAYLHLSERMAEFMGPRVRDALALFGSTSPSYLILQSLDLANRYLEDYPRRLADFSGETAALKERLTDFGYRLQGDEPLKITIRAGEYGYTGEALARLLGEQGIEPEFADPDFLVLMLTPEIGTEGLKTLERALLSIPRKPEINTQTPGFSMPHRVMSPRQAMMSPQETIYVEESRGRILAAVTVGCPPAVPILVCGEEIDENAIKCFRYYGIKTCTVVKD